MTQGLHRLVYYSRNRVPRGVDLGSEIRDILAKSQQNNAPAKVTGALMFNAGCFAQVLEGERDVLEATFERIQQDDRHSDVSLLAFEPIAERGFAQWSMGFVGTRPNDAAAYADVSAASGFDPSRASGDQVLQTLHELALEDEAYAA